jgi:hypothetical protein
MEPVKVTWSSAGRALAKLMPPMESIPEDFRRDRGEARKWIALQQQWFFCGLKGYEFISNPGIDKADALRHLGTIQGSFEPKHEHKEAAVAWLMSLWFEDVVPPKTDAPVSP